VLPLGPFAEHVKLGAQSPIGLHNHHLPTQGHELVLGYEALGGLHHQVGGALLPHHTLGLATALVPTQEGVLHLHVAVAPRALAAALLRSQGFAAPPGEPLLLAESGKGMLTPLVHETIHPTQEATWATAFVQEATLGCLAQLARAIIVDQQGQHRTSSSSSVLILFHMEDHRFECLLTVCDCCVPCVPRGRDERQMPSCLGPFGFLIWQN